MMFQHTSGHIPRSKHCWFEATYGEEIEGEQEDSEGAKNASTYPPRLQGLMRPL